MNSNLTNMVPEVFDGMWCSQPGIGGARFTASGNDYIVEWVTFVDGIKSDLKSASLNDLQNSPDQKPMRYELGMAISECIATQAMEAVSSSGLSPDAFEKAATMKNAAVAWAKWAQS